MCNETYDPKPYNDSISPEHQLSYSLAQLDRLLRPKSLEAFDALGGHEDLNNGLRTNRLVGSPLDWKDLNGTVPSDQAIGAGLSQSPGTTGSSAGPSIASQIAKMPEKAFQDRRRIHNKNRLPKRKIRHIPEPVWGFEVSTLPVAAVTSLVISLVLEVYQLVHAEKGEVLVDLVNIMVAGLITSVFSGPIARVLVDLIAHVVSTRDYLLYRQLKDQLKGSPATRPISKLFMNSKGIVTLLAIVQMMTPAFASDGAVDQTINRDKMWPSNERPSTLITCLILILFNICTRIWSRQFKNSVLASFLLCLSTLAMCYGLHDIIASKTLLLW